jgi:hypothetical protein
VQTFSEEFSSGIRKQVIKNDAFQKLLYYASMGVVKVHNEIPREAVEMKEKIAEGAGGELTHSGRVNFIDALAQVSCMKQNTAISTWP